MISSAWALLTKQKNISSVSSSFIPSEETWQWETSWASLLEGVIGQLQEINQNITFLYSFKPLVNRGLRPELSYLLVHPDMPKSLVAPFVGLVLSHTRKASDSSSSSDE